MSSPKKRAKTGSYGSNGGENESYPDKAALVSGGRNNSMKSSSRKDITAGNESFLRKMKIRHNTEMVAVNKNFGNYLERAANNGRPPSLSAVNERIRAENTIDGRYDFQTDCDIVVMGSNDFVQLSFCEEDNKEFYPPTKLTSLPKVNRIAAGGLHSVALCGGVPYSWGNHDEGTLGRDASDDKDASTPTAVTGFVTNEGVNEDGQVMAIAAGAAHTLFLTASGNVYQCGQYKDMDSGKFSDVGGPKGVKGHNAKPVHVKAMPGKVISIHSMETYNAAVLDDHTVVTWGFGNVGELGRSAQMTKPGLDGNYDLGRSFFYKMITDENGVENEEPDLGIVEEHFLTPKPVLFAGPVLKKQVLHVATGCNHLLVVARTPGSDFAQLYTSGSNLYGQLGLGDEKGRHELTHVKALEHEYIAKAAAGRNHSLALSHDGKRLYSFGRAEYGQLGIGFQDTGAFKTTPQPVPFPQEVVIVDIQCGDNHCFAVTTFPSEREVYGWGFGESRASGLKRNFDRDVFYPAKLDLTEYVDGDVIQVHAVAGGGQHSLMLIKRYRSA